MVAVNLPLWLVAFFDEGERTNPLDLRLGKITKTPLQISGDGKNIVCFFTSRQLADNYAVNVGCIDYDLEEIRTHVELRGFLLSYYTFAPWIAIDANEEGRDLIDINDVLDEIENRL